MRRAERSSQRGAVCQPTVWTKRGQYARPVASTLHLGDGISKCVTAASMALSAFPSGTASVPKASASACRCFRPSAAHFSMSESRQGGWEGQLVCTDCDLQAKILLRQ